MTVTVSTTPRHRVQAPRGGRTAPDRLSPSCHACHDFVRVDADHPRLENPHATHILHPSRWTTVPRAPGQPSGSSSPPPGLTRHVAYLGEPTPKLSAILSTCRIIAGSKPTTR